MNELKVITNNVPREIIYGYDLPESVVSDFDYYSAEELETASFIHYRGTWYDLGQFMRVDGLPEFSPLRAWDGYHGESYFSGAVFKFNDPNCETVVMGRYVQ